MTTDQEQESIRTTLDSEVKSFISSQPYWARYICSQILSGTEISDDITEIAFSYLLEDLGLKEKTPRSDNPIIDRKNTSSSYLSDVRFIALRDIEGVNALTGKQKIEFTPNLTVIYGANGSGKSGYVRLFKNSFYSRDIPPILPNINMDDFEKKSISATFDFSSNGNTISLQFPNDLGQGVFSQFAVFDGDIGRKHLTHRNDFSFRPSGLKLFNEYNTAIEKLNTRLIKEMQNRNILNPFAGDDIFQGKSVIKDFIISLSKDSNLLTLTKYLPYTEEDNNKKHILEKQYDDIKIKLAQKVNTIRDLKTIRSQLSVKRDTLEKINSYFLTSKLSLLNDLIADLQRKENIAIQEGIDKFKTQKISNVGSVEWKSFIQAADIFAKTQDSEGYPNVGDNCLFCQQPLNSEASRILVKNYWTYIKSVAEQELKSVREQIQSIVKEYRRLIFSQFPESDSLTVWFSNKDKKQLESIQSVLIKQELFCSQIIASLENPTLIPNNEILIDLSIIDSEQSRIDSDIDMLESNEEFAILDEILQEIVFLTHKEKLGIRFAEIQKIYENMLWIDKANKFNKQSFKTQSTKTEKRLSLEFFNKNYISSFNKECYELDGLFGIEIDTKSTDAQSNRQLLLKGRDPSSILSEGEQKVIELADFIAETNITEINKGLIFDDPVTSLDNERKKKISERLVLLSLQKQVVVFTHDLAFVSYMEKFATDYNARQECHWIENRDGNIGIIWLRNSPSYESRYRNSDPAKEYYSALIKADCPVEERERLLKNGFSALRTCYEVLVIKGLFCNVVQRYNERVSIDSLEKVKFTDGIKNELISGFRNCCSYMEGHSHTDKGNKIEPKLLNEEIIKFDDIRKRIKDIQKDE